MEERSNERDWWTADREKAQRWIFQFSPEHANLYRGAVQILYGAELPGKLQFVAHAVREIRNGLPRAIEPSDHERFDSKEGIERVGSPSKRTTRCVHLLKKIDKFAIVI